MTRIQIHKAECTIHKLCREICNIKRSNNWKNMEECDLLFELTAAILGSQVSYEIAGAAACRLRDEGILCWCLSNYDDSTLSMQVEEVLRKPLHAHGWRLTGRQFRFPRLRARHISETIRTIYMENGSLKSILSSCSSETKVRALLIRSALGIGPKQASLFLRNVGYSDNLAILDTHVLRYMFLRGMVSLHSSPASLHAYEKIENLLLEHSFTIGFPLSCLDQAIWITMRVARREAWQ